MWPCHTAHCEPDKLFSISIESRWVTASKSLLALLRDEKGYKGKALGALGPKHRAYSRHREPLLADDFITSLSRFFAARAGGAEKGEHRQVPALTPGLISQQTQLRGAGSPRWGPKAGDTAALSGASGRSSGRRRWLGRSPAICPAGEPPVDAAPHSPGGRWMPSRLGGPGGQERGVLHAT